MIGAAAVLLVLLSAGCKPQSPLLFEGGPRFSALDDGTVRDNRFQLIWAKSANIPAVTGPFEGLTWPQALQFVAEMNARGWPNMDYRDWRLPRVEEIVALMSAFWPTGSGLACLAEGFEGSCRFHVPYAPFIDVIEACYWSGTTRIGNTWQDGRGLYVASEMASVPGRDATAVWAIDRDAHPFALSSTARCGVWPVRGSDRVTIHKRGPAIAAVGKLLFGFGQDERYRSRTTQATLDGLQRSAPWPVGTASRLRRSAMAARVAPERRSLAIRCRTSSGRARGLPSRTPAAFLTRRASAVR